MALPDDGSAMIRDRWPLSSTSSFCPSLSAREAVHRFTLAAGEPLDFGHPGRRHALPQRREATEAIMAAIAALSGQERVDTYNAAPSSDQGARG